jgi:O-methyltransferase involved in polyketide biosynthesis
MAGMADLVNVDLGAVQQTLFIPLAARARESRRRRPVLRDPRAAEILASVDFDATGPVPVSAAAGQADRG